MSIILRKLVEDGLDIDLIFNQIKLFQSKKTDNWATPQWLYDKLNDEFDFDFDPCPLNSKIDGLNIKWG